MVDVHEQQVLYVNVNCFHGYIIEVIQLQLSPKTISTYSHLYCQVTDAQDPPAPFRIIPPLYPTSTIYLKFRLHPYINSLNCSDS